MSEELTGRPPSKLAKRTKLGWQLYNARKLMRNQMEKISRIRDEQTLSTLELFFKFEQELFRIETGLNKIEVDEEPK